MGIVFIKNKFDSTSIKEFTNRSDINYIKKIRKINKKINPIFINKINENNIITIECNDKTAVKILTIIGSKYCNYIIKK